MSTQNEKLSDDQILEKARALRPEWDVEKLLDRARALFGSEAIEKMTEEEKNKVYDTLKLDLVVTEVQEYFARRGASMNTNSEVIIYLSLLTEALLPWSDPRRLQLEYDFNFARARGAVAAKQEFDEQFGRPQLVLPQAPGSPLT